VKTSEGEVSLGILWSKRDGYWEITSYMEEPGAKVDQIPGEFVAPAVTVATVEGDPSFINTNEAFLKAWLSGETDKAMEYFSTGVDECVTTFLEPREEAVSPRDRLRIGIRDSGGRFKRVRDLDSVLKPVEIVHPDLKIVTHQYEKVFTVALVPDEIAEAASCENLARGVRPKEVRSDGIANHYLTAFQFELVGQDSGVISFLWGQENNEWKIISFKVETP
jgi:hypothetical protein